MSALDRLKLLGDGADPLTRWQAEAEVKAETEARERQSAQRQAAESREVAALRAEIADLRARLDERDQTIVRLADTIDILIDKTPNWVEKTIEGRVLKSEAEMCGKIAERFGELMGRIAALDPTQARAAKGEPFRFANEKADSPDEPVIDLPNWRRGNRRLS
jgi:predicted RNase H-like nuclease (RuvC/YqgF family)